MEKKMSTPSDLYPRVHAHVQEMMEKIAAPAQGAIRHPYLTITTSNYYKGLLFCWDNYFSALRFAADGVSCHLRNFLDNMHEYQRSDGFIPNAILADGGPGYFEPDFLCQPFLAQAAAQLLEVSGDLEAAAKDFGWIRRFVDYWLKSRTAPFGLCRWDGPAYYSGIDNEILASILHPSSIIAPDVNAYLYAELRALAFIAERINEDSAAEELRQRADELRESINRHLWSDEIGAFGAYNTSRGSVHISFGSKNQRKGFGAFAYLSSSALPVLYTGAATQEHGETMCRQYVIAPEHFRSPFGIRSLSRSSEYCNYAVLGNPGRFDEYSRQCNSNWQGPVWIPLGWMAFHGLLKYGMRDEAASLSLDIMKSICNCLDIMGSLPENVDGDSGKPLYASHYASWNLMGDLMERYIHSGLGHAPQIQF